MAALAISFNECLTTLFKGQISLMQFLTYILLLAVLFVAKVLNSQYFALDPCIELDVSVEPTELIEQWLLVRVNKSL